MLPNPPGAPLHSQEEFAAYIDRMLQPALQNLMMLENQQPANTIPPYTPSSYDGLYTLPFNDLIELCKGHGIDTSGCRIKLHIVSRIRMVDEAFHVLEGYQLPPLPPDQLIQQYRDQLMAFNGAPDMVTAEEAAALVRKKLSKKPIDIPIATGNVIVIDLGKVKAAPSFYTHNCLYPVGFHSRKQYESLNDPKEEVWYDCWIQEKQGKALFIISLNNTVVSYGLNINETWNALRNMVSERSVLLNYTKKQLRASASVGEDYFGLTNKTVQMGLEVQPEALQCREYLFYSQRAALGHAESISAHEMELARQEQDYVQSRLRIVQSCFEEQHFFISKGALEILVAKCRDILKNRRVIARLRAEEFAAREQAMRKNNERVLAALQKQKSGIKITIKRKALEALPEPSALQAQRLPGNKRAASEDADFSGDVSAAPYGGYNTRKRQERVVQPQVNTRKRQRETQEEENVATHPSPRELFSFPVRAAMIRSLVVEKAPRPTRSDGAAATSLRSQPDLPQRSSLEPLAPQARLPKDLVDDALALWHFLAVFARVLQVPRLSFDTFAACLADPRTSLALDEALAILLLQLFTQLKAVLTQQDCSVPGWKPFTGRRPNLLTWPEFARLLFVCKTWALNGRDAGSILRVFTEDSRKTVEAAMVVDPMEDVMLKASSLRSEEFEKVLAPLSKPDRLRCIRAAALIKRLRLLPQCADVLEPSKVKREEVKKEVKRERDSREVKEEKRERDSREVKEVREEEMEKEEKEEKEEPQEQEPKEEPEETMDLHTLDEELLAGQFTRGGVFDEDLFSAQLSLLWRHGDNKELEEAVSALYHRWVADAVEGERGPWDEVAYIGQGCKLCLLSNEEMAEEATVTCDVCEASFHLSCLVPPLREVPQAGWVCGLCQGFSSQERWKREEQKVEAHKADFDAAVLNPAVLGAMPLKSMVGSSSCSPYDFQALFDAETRSPVFFGYDVSVEMGGKMRKREEEVEVKREEMEVEVKKEEMEVETKKEKEMEVEVKKEVKKENEVEMEVKREEEREVETKEEEMKPTKEVEEEDILSLPPPLRYQRLAILLAHEDPHDMSLRQRFAVVSGVITLAGDLPEIRHFVEGTMEAAEAKVREVHGSKGRETADVKRFCDSIVGVLNNRGTRRRGGRRSKKEQEQVGEKKEDAETTPSLTLSSQATDNQATDTSNTETTNTQATDTQTTESTDTARTTDTAKSTHTEKGKARGWTREEVETLKQAVAQIGEGHWTQIVRQYGDRLGNRSIPGTLVTRHSRIAIREKWKTLHPVLLMREPLHCTPLHLPATYGAVTIVSLGTIRMHAAYASKHFIFPVGFCSFRLLPSLADPTQWVRYTCQILDGGPSGPSFRVSSPELDFHRWTATAAWEDAVRFVAEKTGRRLLESVNGPDLFGFGIEEVAIAIANLPNAGFFKGYVGCERQNVVTSVVEEETTLKTQWHPACLGYAMEETGRACDVTKWSPIFMGYADTRCSYCEICGMPGECVEVL